MAMTGLGLGLTVSCKWVGLFTIALIGVSTIRGLWDMLGDLRVDAVSHGREKQEWELVPKELRS
jgi:dolichyl-phosphate-mannose-protein mannosyltransferase